MGDIFRQCRIEEELEHDKCAHDKDIIIVYLFDICQTIVGGDCDECFGITDMSSYWEKIDKDDPWYQWLRFPEGDLPKGRTR